MPHISPFPHPQLLLIFQKDNVGFQCISDFLAPLEFLIRNQFEIVLYRQINLPSIHRWRIAHIFHFPVLWGEIKSKQTREKTVIRKLFELFIVFLYFQIKSTSSLIWSGGKRQRQQKKNSLTNFLKYRWSKRHWLMSIYYLIEPDRFAFIWNSTSATGTVCTATHSNTNVWTHTHILWSKMSKWWDCMNV